MKADLLNSAKYLFLRQLTEPRDNSLRLVVQEAFRRIRQNLGLIQVQASIYQASGQPFSFSAAGNDSFEPGSTQAEVNKAINQYLADPSNPYKGVTPENPGPPAHHNTKGAKSMSILTAVRAFPLLCVLIAGTAIGARQVSTSAHEKLATITLCELTKNWKKYDHKMIRIEAIYVAEFERSEVYDPACATSTAWVPPVPYGSPGPPPRELEARLNDLLRQDRRARITVVGEFDGPKKVDIPPGTSPGLAATLRAADSHYGHQNRWDFQFVFSKIEKVEPVRASDPWPRWPTEKKK